MKKTAQQVHFIFISFKRKQNQPPRNHWAVLLSPYYPQGSILHLETADLPWAGTNPNPRGNKTLHTWIPSSPFLMFCIPISATLNSTFSETIRGLRWNSSLGIVSGAIFFYQGNKCDFYSTLCLFSSSNTRGNLSDEGVNSCHVWSPSKHRNLHPVPLSKNCTKTYSVANQAMGTTKWLFSFYFWQVLKKKRGR